MYGLHYTIEPGVFKCFCDKAQAVEMQTEEQTIGAAAKIWKLTIKKRRMEPH